MTHLNQHNNNQHRRRPHGRARDRDHEERQMGDERRQDLAPGPTQMG